MTFHLTDSSALLAAVFALDGPTAGLVVEQSLRERGVIDTWDSMLRPAFGALSTLQAEERTAWTSSICCLGSPRVRCNESRPLRRGVIRPT